MLSLTIVIEMQIDFTKRIFIGKRNSDNDYVYLFIYLRSDGDNT